MLAVLTPFAGSAQEAGPAADSLRLPVPDSLRAPATDSLPDARADSVPAAATDSTPAAQAADSVGAGQPPDSAAAVDSLEKVQREIESARARLEEVRQTLETVPGEERLRRSPRGAVLRAFAAPGWGQFYTGHTFRGFMYGAAEVGFATLGFLKQRDVNDFKDEIMQRRLAFVLQEQAANPDTSFSREDTLALYQLFGMSAEGAQLQATLEVKQKRREDFFTYAIFAVLFSAVDAFVSAHLQPFDEPQVELKRAAERWELGVRVWLGGAPGGLRPSVSAPP